MSINFRIDPVTHVFFRLVVSGLLITSALLATAPAAAQASPAFADSTQVGNLGDLIQALEKKWTNYNFLYNIETLRTRTSIPKLDLAKSTLEQSLQALNKAGLITYRIDGNAVSIALLPAKKKTGNGMLTGKVSDKENDDPVSGATIRIGDHIVVTDADGIFSMELPKGNYQAEISSVGYGRKKLPEVEIKDHEALNLEITLTREKGQLQSVVVKAAQSKGSINALYIAQKNNAAITDGISSEQIRRTADRDASQVLRRVAGVSVVDNKFVVVRGLGERYNQAVLNGQLMPSTEINRKNFSFNMIPSGIIERITIVKTLTPDRSAEFGGALVDVKTIDIPTKDFFTISVGANYNDQTTGKDFYTLKLEGKEYLAQVPDHRKFLGTTNWSSDKDMADAWDARKQSSGTPSSFLSNNWGITRFKAPLTPNFQVSFGKLFRQSDNQQWGITAAMGYRNTLQSQDIKMGKNYSALYEAATGKFNGGRAYQSDLITNLNGLLGIAYRNARNSLAYRTLYIRNYEQGFNITDSANHGTYGGNSMGYNDRVNQNTIWQHQLAGEHLPGNKGIKINWIASYTELDIRKPDNHSLIFPATNYLRTGPHWNDYSVEGSGGSSLNAGVLRSWSRANEKNLSWDLSVTVPLKIDLGPLEMNNTIKAGYSGWHKNRYFYLLNMGTMVDRSNGYLQPLDENFTPAFGVNSFVSRFGDAFRNPNAQLHAGYLMLDNKLGKKWRLIWGLRGEYYDLNSQRNLIFGSLEKQGFDVSNLKSQEPNLRWFPSANLVYSLTPTMNLRLAYSKSIIRPDLREMSYLNEYDYELGGSYEAGNLRSTLINHFDFRYEWYANSGSVLSTTVFYKKMDYPMEVYKELNNAYVLRNSKYAKNYGLEMELRQSLSSITHIPVVRNLTIYANMTWLASRIRQKSDSTELVKYPDGSQKIFLREKLAGREISRPQAGASNWLINAGLYYDTKLISASLLYNYMSNRAFVVAVVPGASIFERPPVSLDAQLGVYLLQRKMKLTLNITNLLNEGLFQYMPTHLANEGEEADVKPGDLKYRNGNDVFYRAKPGRTFGFSISYNL